MTSPRPAAFALPGDITTLTGGYIYDRRLVEGLRAQGRAVRVIQLPDSFPTPDDGDMDAALVQTSSAERVSVHVHRGRAAAPANTPPHAADAT